MQTWFIHDHFVFCITLYFVKTQHDATSAFSYNHHAGIQHCSNHHNNCLLYTSNTPQAWLDFAKTFKPSPLRLLLKVRLPAALPAFASGFRIAVSVAPIGAVIGEWVGSSEGLGYLMIHANARMQVDLMFAALLILVAISLCLYFSIDWLLRRFIWHV